jgi:hypothetical protein
MAESLHPLTPPPKPPHLTTLLREWPERLQPWAESATRWTEELIRVLESGWRKLQYIVNAFETRLAAAEASLVSLQASVAALQASVATLEARAKDVLTYSLSGSAITGRIGLPLLAPATGTLFEVAVRAETAPTGASLIVDVRKNGASQGTVTVAAGSNQTVTGFSVAVTKDTDWLEAVITQVGSTVPGSDVVAQFRVR